MSRRVAPTLSSSLWVLTAVLVAVSLVALRQFWSGPMDLVDRWTLGGSLVALSCASVGTIIVRRHPRHPVGWLFTGIALQTSVSLSARHLAEAAVARGDLAGARWPALVMMVGVSLAFPLVSLLLLLYPHGRLPSARWRVIAVLAVTLLVLGALVGALTPFAAATQTPFPTVRNPLGVLPFGTGGALHDFVGSANLVLLLLAGASLVVRWRRSTGLERYQIKWLAWAAAYATVTFSVVTVVVFEPGLAFLLTFPLLPIAAAIGILRHGLYEIDRIISRTVSYALLTGLLILIYLGTVFALQGLLRPITGESQPAVAGATLAVAALFVPARRRVQIAVDRRFNRARYDAQRIVDEFRARLRDEIDLDQLGTELVAAVDVTVEPDHASLWLRSHNGRREP